MRDSGTEVLVEPDSLNGLEAVCAARCQHIQSVARSRVSAQMGNVGAVALRHVRNAVAALIDA